MLILLCHFSYSFVQYNIGGFHNFLLAYNGFDSGRVGVCLFFMLSGSAMALNYGEAPFRIGAFYKKRALRIYPTLYLSWLAFYVIKVWQKKAFFYNGSVLRMIWTVLGIDFYIGGVTPTYAIVGEWFTGTIIILYLLFPLVRFLYRKAYHATFTVLCLLFLLHVYVRPLPHINGVDSIVTYLFYFYSGMVLIKERERIRKIPFVLSAGLLCGIFLIPNTWSIYANTYLISILVYLLCAKLPQANGFAKKAVGAFGVYSYAVYLVHHQIIYLVVARYAGQFLSAGKKLALLCLIAALVAVVSVVVTKIAKLFTDLLLRIGSDKMTAEKVNVMKTYGKDEPERPKK